MRIQEIKSASNGLVKLVRSLELRKNREKEQLFLVEGERAVGEAFQKNMRVRDVLVSQTYLASHLHLLGASSTLTRFPNSVPDDRLDQIRGADVQSQLQTSLTGAVENIKVIDDKLFNELAKTTTPSGIMALVDMPTFSWEALEFNSKTLIVVACNIQDPGNLGTIIRTSLAASATALLGTKGTVDLYNPKVVRSAMGALFSLPAIWGLTLGEIVEKLKAHGVRVLACDANGSSELFEATLTGPLALVFGNEGNGFTLDELNLFDEVLSIPMNPQSESLNVAISAAIVLFNVVQQRLKSGSSG